MQVRDEGRWGNTQENAWAMESLVDYYRKYESEMPDFTGVVTLGSDALANDAFKGRSTRGEEPRSLDDAVLQKHAAADVPDHVRSPGNGHALLPDAAPLHARPDCCTTRSTKASTSSGSTAQTEDVQGRRSDQGHAAHPQHEGAALRRRHRSDSRRHRAGRVVVRHDRDRSRRGAGEERHAGR